MNSIGVDSQKVREVAADPHIARILDRFAARNTILGYVPSFSGTGKPAWIFATWAGAHGQLARWGLYDGLASDLRKIKLDRHRKIWVLDCEEMGPGWCLSLSVADGVLLGCLSSDPTGVKYIMNRLRSGALIVPELQESLESRSEGECSDRLLGASARVLDRGWVNWRRFRDGSLVSSKLRYALAPRGESSLTGWVKGDSSLFVAPPASGERSLGHSYSQNLTQAVSVVDAPVLRGAARLERLLLGGTPDAAVIAPFSYVEPYLSGRNASAGLKVTGQTLCAGAAEEACVFAGLFSGDYSGRILGLKVPTLMVGVEVKDPVRVPGMVEDMLDGLNAQYGWALIPRRASVDGHSLQGTPDEALTEGGIVMLDSTREGIYGSLRPRERPAFTSKEGWLVFSSNMEALVKLVNRQTGGLRPVTAASDTNAKWFKGMAEREGSAYAWLDLEPTSRALKNAMAVYSLVLMVQKAEGNAKTRESLERVKVWLDVICSWKTCSLWITAGGSEFEACFTLGQG